MSLLPIATALWAKSRVGAVTKNAVMAAIRQNATRFMRTSRYLADSARWPARFFTGGNLPRGRPTRKRKRQRPRRRTEIILHPLNGDQFDEPSAAFDNLSNR